MLGCREEESALSLHIHTNISKIQSIGSLFNELGRVVFCLGEEEGFTSLSWRQAERLTASKTNTMTLNIVSRLNIAHLNIAHSKTKTKIWTCTETRGRRQSKKTERQRFEYASYGFDVSI